MHEARSTALAASYFDGTHATEHAVALRLQGGDLQISGESLERTVPAAALQWPPTGEKGMRVMHFSHGGSVHCADGAAWDAWCKASGRSGSLVERMQASWPWVLACAAALIGLLIGMQQWGIPLLAEVIVDSVPATVESAIGESALEGADRLVLGPSQMPARDQQRLRAAFARLLAAQPAGSVPSWRLEFRQSRIGPNAFALPGGVMIMTDELVALLASDDAVIMGVLAHEFGHVRHRHGLRMLVQATVLSGMAALIFGDFSNLFAAAPAVLGNSSYSRRAERQADQESARMLDAAGISPLVMVRLFERLASWRSNARDPGAARPDDEPPADWVGIGIASHPSDAERIRFFTDAARR